MHSASPPRNGSGPAITRTTVSSGLDVVIAGTALGYHEGGLSNYVRQLAGGLKRARPAWRVRLMAPDGARVGSLPADIVVDRVPREWRSMAPLLSEIATGLAMGRKAARDHPGAVFISPTDFWSVVVPARRIAVTHDTIPESDRISRGSWLRRINRRLSIQFARTAEQWIAVSHTAVRDIGRVHGGERLPTAIPNWVDDRFRAPITVAQIAELRNRLRLPPRFFLYVGGYRKYKNVETLIRAHTAARLQADIPPLLLAGSVPLNPATTACCDVRRELQRAGAAPESIVMPGRISDADLPVLYATASLFVSASLLEGFGYPAVEAMAVGCPVLVADRTAFREVVPRGECRFNPDNEAELSALFIAAAANPQQFHCPFLPIYSELEGAERFARCVEVTAQIDLRGGARTTVAAATHR